MMKKRMKAQRNGPDQEVILMMMMMISFCMPQAGCTSVSFK